MTLRKVLQKSNKTVTKKHKNSTNKRQKLASESCLFWEGLPEAEAGGRRSGRSQREAIDPEALQPLAGTQRSHDVET